MRKTKAVKQVCILLAMVLMFSTINTHVTATPATPETNDASHYSEAAPALNEVDAMYIMHEADNLPERSIVTEYTPVRNVAQSEPTQGTFDGWYFYMFFDPDVGLYYVPDFGLHFDPAIPMFYAAHLDLWLENHTIACASESTEMLSTYRLEGSETLDDGIEIIWADPEEEEYYRLHGRLRNLADYLTDTNYHMFRISGMALEEFLESGMAHGDNRNNALGELGNEGELTLEQFEAFYTLELWQEAYEAVRELDINLTEYETMLARSGLTLSERVAGMLIAGVIPTDIIAAIEYEMALDLEFHCLASQVAPLAAGTPGLPNNVSAIPNHDQRTIQLNWTPPTTNAGTIIRYEVSLNGGAWTWLGQNIRSHTFTVPLGNHTVRVRAVNSAGAGQIASRTAAVAIAPTVEGFLTSRTRNSATFSGTVTHNGGAPIAYRGVWHRRTVDASATPTYQTGTGTSLLVDNDMSKIR